MSSATFKSGIFGKPFILKWQINYLQRVLFCTKCEPQSSLNLTDGKVKNESKPHVPVMVEQVMKFLNPTNGKVFLDMTFGAGGHTRELLKAADNITVIALDRDPVAFGFARELQNLYPEQVIPLNGKFSDLPQLLQAVNVQRESIDGVLFDVGCSSMQLDDTERGFSYLRDAPLDMRMCREGNVPTAADVLNSLEVQDLARILKAYGDVKQSRKIAQTIIDSKFMIKPVRTTRQLAMVVRSVYSKNELTPGNLGQSSHFAAQVFQALRIFVNNEINELDYGINVAHKYLKETGMMVAISFHSVEDKVVTGHLRGVHMPEPSSSTYIENYKNIGRKHTAEEISSVLKKKWNVLTKKPIVPTEEEIKANSRSRSAKLRAAEKLNFSS